MAEPRGMARPGQRLLPGQTVIERVEGDAGTGMPLVPLHPIELLRVLRRHLALILVVTTLSTGLAVAWIMTHAPFYSARAVVRLNNGQRSMTGGLADGPMDVLGGPAIDPVLSLVEVLQSRTVAGQVVDSLPELRIRLSGAPAGILTALRYDTEERVDSITLRFRDHSVLVSHRGTLRSAPFGAPIEVDGARFRVNGRPDAETATLTVLSRDGAIQQLLAKLKVAPRITTDVVDVAYKNHDPRLAQRVANIVVRTFEEASAERGKQQSVRRRQFLEQQLKYQDSVLSAARQALTQFRGRQEAMSARAKLSTQEQDLGGLTVKQEELVSQREIVRGLLQRLATPGVDPSDGLGALLAMPDVATNTNIQQLFSELMRYRALRDSLTAGRWGSRPDHPDVIRANQLIAATQAQLVSAFRGLEASLDSRIASLDNLRRQNAVAVPQLSVSQSQEEVLQESLEAAQKTTQELRGEYERARLAEAVGVGEVEVIDAAPLPRIPDGIAPPVQILFGFLMGLVLGVSGACVLEFLNTSIRRRNQVAQVLQLSELAVIPPLPPVKRRRLRDGGSRVPATRSVSPTLVMQQDRHSLAAEAYRLLRTNLIFSDANGTPRTITVTSASPGEGKTVTAANLALAFAQQGISALLIDADLRRGRVHALFNAAQKPGLSEVLRGQASLDAVARPAGPPNLSIVTTGAIPADPAELLAGGAMAAVLAQASQTHSVVIVDTAPLLAVADASVIASRTDATILVVRAGQTKMDEAKVAIGQLTAVGANVVGVVMNDRDAEMHRYGEVYYGGNGAYAAVADSQA
jgi:succinoglycan biosynthesis transport protein ExoP